LRKLDSFQIQIWLNGLAAKGYSESVVRSCFSNVRAIAARNAVTHIHHLGKVMNSVQAEITRPPEAIQKICSLGPKIQSNWI
jgi:hypothetical protein